MQEHEVRPLNGGDYFTIGNALVRALSRDLLHIN